MASHQGHSRHGGNSNWQDESRDEQGRFQSGNEGTSDSDGQRDRDDGYSRGGMRGGHDRGLEMHPNDRDRGNYEADYGFPQEDRGARWTESGRAGEYRRNAESRDRNDSDRYGQRGDMWRGRDGGYGTNERGWNGSSGEETYGPRGRYGDDRSGQGGYPMGSNNERSTGRGDRMRFDDRDRQWDYGRNASGSYDMGSPYGYDADNYRSRDQGSRWGSQGDASQGFESRHRGEHAGKGPKGYKRSDERIEEDVNEALARDPSIDASEVEVNVNDGEVTLSGTVPDRRMKRRAEDCAEACSGVTEVQNHLRLESDKQQGSTAESSRSSKSGSKHGGNGASAGSGANSTSGSTSKQQSHSSTQ